MTLTAGSRLGAFEILEARYELFRDVRGESGRPQGSGIALA